MTHVKEISAPPDFLEYIKSLCLKWAEEVVESNNAPHPFLKHRQRPHHIINTASWDEWDRVEAYAGVREAREIKRRQILMLREYGLVNRIVIEQYDMPEMVNKWIQDAVYQQFGIPHDETMPILQIQNGGELLHPHQGHGREASMFCLLRGEGEVTKWYEEIAPFEQLEKFRIPDLSKLEVKTEYTMKENQWVLFNHKAWHSVHRKSDVGVRINLGVDFKTMNIKQSEDFFDE